MPDKDPAAPALGFSIVANLNQKRQITCQAFIERDAADDEIAGVLDKVMRQVDRQENFYLILDYELVIEKTEEEIKTYEMMLVKAKAQTEAAAEEHNTRISEIETKARNQHEGRERRGPFVLTGLDKQNVERIETALAALKDKHKAEQDNLEITITGAKKKVVDAKKKIEDLRASLGVKKNGSNSGANLHTS